VGGWLCTPHYNPAEGRGRPLSSSTGRTYLRPHYINASGRGGTFFAHAHAGPARTTRTSSLCSRVPISRMAGISILSSISAWCTRHAPRDVAADMNYRLYTSYYSDISPLWLATLPRSPPSTVSIPARHGTRGGRDKGRRVEQLDGAAWGIYYIMGKRVFNVCDGRKMVDMDFGTRRMGTVCGRTGDRAR